MAVIEMEVRLLNEFGYMLAMLLEYPSCTCSGRHVVTESCLRVYGTHGLSMLRWEAAGPINQRHRCAELREADG